SAFCARDREKPGIDERSVLRYGRRSPLAPGPDVGEAERAGAIGGPGAGRERPLDLDRIAVGSGAPPGTRAPTGVGAVGARGEGDDAARAEVGQRVGPGEGVGVGAG